MKILHNAEYSRLVWMRTAAFMLWGATWCALMVMVLLWNTERTNAMQLRSRLVNVIELNSLGME